MTDLLVDETGSDDASTGRLAGSRLRRVRENARGRRLWGTIVVGLVILGVLGPVLAPGEQGRLSLVERLQPPVGFGGEWAHPLGTDGLGRDMLSQILIGARVSLAAGVGATLIAIVVGVPIGLLAGYRRGWIDKVVTSLIEVQLAVPPFLLLIMVTTFVGRGLVTIVVVLSLVSWIVFARFARNIALSMGRREFIEAAELSGTRPGRIVFRHLLPNMSRELGTLGLLEVARLMLSEATVSFLGFGVQPPDTSWGLMIAQGQPYIRQNWWVVTLPGLLILISVLAFNGLARGRGGRPGMARFAEHHDLVR